MFKALPYTLSLVCTLVSMPSTLAIFFIRLSVCFGLVGCGGVFLVGYNNGILKWAEIVENGRCPKPQNICNVFAMYLTIKYLDCSNLFARVR